MGAPKMPDMSEAANVLSTLLQVSCWLGATSASPVKGQGMGMKAWKER